MEKSNEEKDLLAFSWPTFFVVGGISLFVFAFILRLLDGQHTNLFLYAGSISLSFGIIGWMLTRRS